MLIFNTISIRSGFAAFIAMFAILLASLQPTYASEQLVKKYQELAEASGFSFTYGNLETLAEDAFTLHDIVLIKNSVEDPVKIKSMTLKGVKELSGIGLSADKFNIKGLSWDGRDKQGTEIIVLLREAEYNGFYLPDPKDLDAPLFVFDNYTGSISDFSALVDGKTVVEMPSAVTEFTGSVETGQFDGFLRMSNVSLHTGNLGQTNNMRRSLNALGYDKLEMGIDIEMDWNAQTGRMALSKYEFDVKDIGALDIQMIVGGYTEALNKKIRALNAEIQALPAQERDLASKRILEEMSAITMESMKLSFRDNSITNKLIALQAQAQGQPPENMKAMLPIMLNGVLAGLQQPELAAKLVSAVEAFLAQPGTISVAASPEAPLSFAEIAGLAVALPGILIEKLNITAVAQ